MTFSIVGRADDGPPGRQSLGVAVASKFLAVGSAVPAARLGVGAIATQSYANTLYRRDGLSLLSEGKDAEATVEALLAADEGREHRQVGIVDSEGRAATFTGTECLDWAGGVTGPGYAIQGNILTGPDVVADMETAWLDSAGADLPERLMAALAAGDAAGGDRRGRQSAALFVVSDTGAYTPGDDLAYDLRIDDHAAPVGELERLLGLHHVFFDEPGDDDWIAVEGAVAAEIQDHLHVLGIADLATWAGIENYEMRTKPGSVDSFVLDKLREQAAAARA